MLELGLDVGARLLPHRPEERARGHERVGAELGREEVGLDADKLDAVENLRRLVDVPVALLERLPIEGERGGST